MDIQLTIKDENNESEESIILYDEKATYDGQTEFHTFFCESTYESHSILVRVGCDAQSIQVLVMVNSEQKLMYIGQMGHKSSSFVVNVAPKTHLCITII